MSKSFSSLFLLILLGISGGPGFENQPNIVILFSDDAGYADFGFQGNSLYATPNIDRIAENGIRFTSAYVSASVCSPSRAGLMTGRYQQRFGHEYNLPGMDDPEVARNMRGLPLSEITIADLLKEAGYATGLIGKWHLGMHPSFRPDRRGFDEFFGMLRGGSPYRPGTADAIRSNYREVDYRALPYLTDAFGDEAVAFIERHRDEPFFLFLSFNAPHTPLEARPDYLAESSQHFETEARAVNAAMTRSLDENIGKVLQKLDALDLTANTIVIFTNDNGGAMPYNASNNAPLRGTKGTVLEGGIRVPFAMQWPDGLSGGRTFDEAISTLDILPTVLEAAGGRVPGDRDLDGVNLLPFLNGLRTDRPHGLMYWKLNWGAAIRVGDWKLVRTPADDVWLFDLREDISESHDLSGSHPDIVERLSSDLVDWEATLPPPIWVSAPMWREHSLERYDQQRVRSFVRR